MTSILAAMVRALLLLAPLMCAGLRAQSEIVIVDAAAFQERAAPGMLASGFTEAIGDVRETALTQPLPTELAGFSLEVEDSAGRVRAAELIGVFEGQVNFVLSNATALGVASVRLLSGGQVRAEGEMLVESVAPGVFTANASGEGAPAGFVLFSSATGMRQEPLFEFDAMAGAFRIRAFDMSNPDEEVRLILFGTGIRGRTSLENIVAQVNGVPVAAEFAGDQTEFAGLDQVNLGPLPRILDGAGPAPVSLLFDTQAANVVDIEIAGAP